MKLAAVALAACTLVVAAAAGTLPLLPWYTCDPSTCKAENNCRCASMEPPLPANEVPQFILYTHDDGIIPEIFDAVKKTIRERKNPNGCSIPLTWFTIKYDTVGHCDLVKELWQEGHEIALHTRDHVRLDPPIDATDKDQIVSVRTWLNESCGIPAEDMVGMRSPFLVNSPGVREVLAGNGFLYDSTINDHWTPDGMWPTSKDGGNRLWPYTMDSGIPQDCAFTGPDGSCTKEERYPGLWEVPVWVLQTSKYPMDAYAMDPGGDVFALLKLNFDAAYAGNRAPVPIFMHKPWMVEAKNQMYVQQFMDYALGKPDVWFVTMHQLIDWIRNPIPASEMKARFNVGCKSGGAGAISSMSMPSSTPDASLAVAPTPAPATTTPVDTPAAPTPAGDAPVVAASPSPAVQVPASAPAPAPVNAAGAAAPVSLAAAALLALALMLLL